jgi:hypothetical protein
VLTLDPEEFEPDRTIINTLPQSYLRSSRVYFVLSSEDFSVENSCAVLSLVALNQIIILERLIYLV